MSRVERDEAPRSLVDVEARGALRATAVVAALLLTALGFAAVGVAHAGLPTRLAVIADRALHLVPFPLLALGAIGSVRAMVGLRTTETLGPRRVATMLALGGVLVAACGAVFGSAGEPDGWSMAGLLPMHGFGDVRGELIGATSAFLALLGIGMLSLTLLNETERSSTGTAGRPHVWALRVSAVTGLAGALAAALAGWIVVAHALGERSGIDITTSGVGRLSLSALAGSLIVATIGWWLLIGLPRRTDGAIERHAGRWWVIVGVAAALGLTGFPPIADGVFLRSSALVVLLPDWRVTWGVIATPLVMVASLALLVVPAVSALAHGAGGVRRSARPWIIAALVLWSAGAILSIVMTMPSTRMLVEPSTIHGAWLLVGALGGGAAVAVAALSALTGPADRPARAGAPQLFVAALLGIALLDLASATDVLHAATPTLHGLLSIAAGAALLAGVVGVPLTPTVIELPVGRRRTVSIGEPLVIVERGVLAGAGILVVATLLPMGSHPMSAVAQFGAGAVLGAVLMAAPGVHLAWSKVSMSLAALVSLVAAGMLFVQTSPGIHARTEDAPWLALTVGIVAVLLGLLCVMSARRVSRTAAIVLVWTTLLLGTIAATQLL